MQYIIVDIYICTDMSIYNCIVFYTTHSPPHAIWGGGRQREVFIPLSFHLNFLTYFTWSPFHIPKIPIRHLKFLFSKKYGSLFFWSFHFVPHQLPPEFEHLGPGELPGEGIHTSIHHRWLLVLWPHEVQATLPETCSRKPSGCNRAAQTRVFFLLLHQPSPLFCSSHNFWFEIYSLFVRIFYLCLSDANLDHIYYWNNCLCSNLSWAIWISIQRTPFNFSVSPFDINSIIADCEKEQSLKSVAGSGKSTRHQSIQRPVSSKICYEQIVFPPRWLLGLSVVFFGGDVMAIHWHTWYSP